MISRPPVTQNPRKVAVIGAGYVGIPTAVTLAVLGHEVVLAERDPRRLSVLASGHSPIHEPGLEEILQECLASGALRCVGSAVEAVAGADVTFLCVPTPQDDDGSADLSYVIATATEIKDALKQNSIVVNKSTVPVRTADLVERTINRPDIAVVSNPEFLREGTAVADSLAPDRIVVGSTDPRAATAVAELFGATGASMVLTDPTTAETIKYASNAFLATKISFINAMAALCEAVGADVTDVILGMGFDKRIGFEFLKPGPGWGGSCFPKDTLALLNIAERHGYDFGLLRGAVESNDEQIERMVKKISTAAGGLQGTVVAVWGLTFKANTDDRRSSPAISIVRRLVDEGAIVQAFDPTVTVAEDASAPDLEGVTIAADAVDAATGASVLALLTEWQDFRWADFATVGKVMASKSIVDARNLLEPEQIKNLGFTYVGVGRS